MKPTAFLISIFSVLAICSNISRAVTFSDVTSYSNLDNYPLARCSAWIDYDRDGHLDLIVGSEYGNNRLHRNNGDGTFANVTEEAGVPHRSGIWGVNFADINNDGFQEIYLSARAPDTFSAGRNILLLNNSGTCFTDISEISGANAPGGGVAACFAPFDKNAYIDLFVPNQYYPDMEYPYLLINMMDNTFEDQTTQYGLYILDWWDVPVVFDYDNNRVLDLFCTKDYHGNSLYKRTWGSHFEDWTDSLNIQTACGYGATIGDVNNDGWLDLYLTNWHNLTDNLFIYDTSGSYINMTLEWNVPGNIWTSAPHFADFDNDGWLDLVVMAAGSGNRYYRNVNGAGFEDNTLESGLTNSSYNWGASIGDYNNDGFLDIFVPEYIHSPNGGRLYRNNGNENNWVQIELIGTNCNRDGIGARLWLNSQSTRQTRQVMGGSGFGSQNSLIQHFGLAQDTVINFLEIWWPDGTTEIYEAISINQLITIVQGGTLYINQGRRIVAPESFQLRKAYPNPFNYAIEFEIEVLRTTFISVEINDILGRKARCIFEGSLDPGTFRCFWDGSDSKGINVTSGIYFVRISNGIDVDIEKVTLVK
jgi:hypothetical protein